MEYTRLRCNGCGRELEIQREIPQEEVLEVEHSWGYFFGKGRRAPQLQTV